MHLSTLKMNHQILLSEVTCWLSCCYLALLCTYVKELLGFFFLLRSVCSSVVSFVLNEISAKWSGFQVAVCQLTACWGSDMKVPRSRKFLSF